MKKLALNDVHIAAGGKMVEFAGHSMPVQYSGLNDEKNQKQIDSTMSCIEILSSKVD